MYKYKLKDLQGGGLKEDREYPTKADVIEDLASFHSVDFECEECEDLKEHLNKQGFNNEDEELKWLLEWGQWELVPVRKLIVNHL